MCVWCLWWFVVRTICTTDGRSERGLYTLITSCWDKLSLNLNHFVNVFVFLLVTFSVLTYILVTCSLPTVIRTPKLQTKTKVNNPSRLFLLSSQRRRHFDFWVFFEEQPSHDRQSDSFSIFFLFPSPKEQALLILFSCVGWLASRWVERIFLVFLLQI